MLNKMSIKDRVQAGWIVDTCLDNWEFGEDSQTRTSDG